MRRALGAQLRRRQSVGFGQEARLPARRQSAGRSGVEASFSSRGNHPGIGVFGVFRHGFSSVSGSSRRRRLARARCCSDLTAPTVYPGGRHGFVIPPSRYLSVTPGAVRGSGGRARRGCGRFQAFVGRAGGLSAGRLPLRAVPAAGAAWRR